MTKPTVAVRKQWTFRFHFPTGGGGTYICKTLPVAREAQAWMRGNKWRCERIRVRPAPRKAAKGGGK